MGAPSGTARREIPSVGAVAQRWEGGATPAAKYRVAGLAWSPDSPGSNTQAGAGARATQVDKKSPG